MRLNSVEDTTIPMTYLKFKDHRHNTDQDNSQTLSQQFHLNLKVGFIREERRVQATKADRFVQLSNTIYSPPDPS